MNATRVPNMLTSHNPDVHIRAIGGFSPPLHRLHLPVKKAENLFYQV